MDIDHIEWMMKAAEKVCNNEGLDKTIFIPLVILHDVGYSRAQDPKDNSYKLAMRRAHMEAGAKLAIEILEQLNYPKDKAGRISYYISVHDSWALDNSDEFRKDKMLGAFNDLDFMWMATPKGFPAVITILKKDKKDMLSYIETNDKLKDRPWSTATTKQMFEAYIADLHKKM